MIAEHLELRTIQVMPPSLEGKYYCS